LFTVRPGFYLLNALLLAGLLTVGLSLLVSPAPFWFKLLDAVLLAFVFTHLGYLAHDAGHRQIFTEPWKNDVALLSVGLLVGMSRSWWVDNHNQHHNNPNDLSLDPHTAIPVVAFSEEQARSKQGLVRWLTGYQSFYFFPMLSLEGIGLRLASLQYLLRGKARYRLAEALAMIVHLALYLGLVFTVMSPWQAGLFIAVHQGLAGVYLGMVFAPNHKGMPILLPGHRERFDFLRRQVITTRNIAPHPVIDFLLGGLNYQIEHHLFPKLPRHNLGKARRIVRSFCQERAIPYHETGLLASYLEVFRYLRRVGAAA
jgi:fatty acid desaturase